MIRFLLVLSLLVFVGSTVRLAAEPPQSSGSQDRQAAPNQGRSIRVATYNVSLYDKGPGKVLERLKSGNDQQAKQIAAIIQTVSPDILLLNEIDYDEKGELVETFNKLYLEVLQDKAIAAKDRETPLGYPYRYAVPSNTGQDSRLDLNKNGKLGEAADGWGFGRYEGQYAMAVLSRFPIHRDQIRTFQHFLWKDLPGAKEPVDPQTSKPYYGESVWEQLRLSSKNHVDVPIDVDGKTIHLLASHPTPPVFDGLEDRNGCRNRDEIVFWRAYISPGLADSLTDDAGVRGGLVADALFVIAGDLNSDPIRGDSQHEAIVSLLEHPRVIDTVPTRMGSSDKRRNQTSAFGRGREMRIDYVLPSHHLKPIRSEVFWPDEGQTQHELVTASDHRMVWVEVQLP